MENELKQKQIEDLTALIDSFNIRTIKQAKYVAEYIVDKLNYRKIPEGEVVIKKEVYERLCDLAYFGNGEETIRKETAEKFAEMLKADVSEDNELHEALNAYLKRDYFEYIDEICKEITEGKDGE